MAGYPPGPGSGPCSRSTPDLVFDGGGCSPTRHSISIRPREQIYCIPPRVQKFSDVIEGRLKVTKGEGRGDIR